MTVTIEKLDHPHQRLLGQLHRLHQQRQLMPNTIVSWQKMLPCGDISTNGGLVQKFMAQPTYLFFI
jgi:hypothetical protein